MASALTALGMLLATLFLTPALFYLSKVTLAATIIVAVMALFDLSTFRHAWHYDKADFTAVALTFALTLLAGVEWGVLAGVVSSLALYVLKTAQPHIAEVGLLPDSESFRNVKRHEVTVDARLLSLRPDESLYFINAGVLAERVMKTVAERHEIQHVIIQCNAVNHIDLSALETLTQLNETLAQQAIKLHLSEVKGPVADRLAHGGLLSQLSGDVFLTHFMAWTALRQSLG